MQHILETIEVRSATGVNINVEINLQVRRLCMQQYLQAELK